MNGYLFIRKNGIISGPFAVSRIQEMYRNGMLRDEDEVSLDKLEWKSAAVISPVSTKNPQILDTVPQRPLAPPPPPQFAEMTLAGKEPAWEGESSGQPKAPGVAPVAILLTPEQPTTSHLWIFCHLVCAMMTWKAHEKTLERRCQATCWTAIAYAILVTFVPVAIFCRLYTPMHGCLWGMAMMAGAIVALVGIAYACIGIACRLRVGEHSGRLAASAVMTLLMHGSTLLGTMLVLLHALRHPHPLAKIAALVVLLLAVSCFAGGSCQLFQNFVLPAGGTIRRRGALWTWCLWIFLVLSGFSFLSFFALKLL